jgi:hypothetical protein
VDSPPQVNSGQRPVSPRLLRAARVAVLIQALALLAVIGLAIPSYLDFRFHPISCPADQGCLDLRDLTIVVTAMSLGPAVLLLLTTYWLLRRPRRWHAALPLAVDIAVVGIQVFDPYLIAEGMTFALNGRPPAPSFTYSYVAVQVLLMFLPAVVSLTLILALLRRWDSKEPTPSFPN